MKIKKAGFEESANDSQLHLEKGYLLHKNHPCITLAFPFKAL
jgi:hypothetical protein